MKRYFPSWIALAVGFVFTIVASLEVKKAIEQDAVDEIAFTSEQVTLKIRERLDAYALTLKGGAGIFAASNEVDRREWQAYVEKLRAQDSLPGVQGIGFSQVIPPQQLAAHIARVRAEGFPDYTVRPAGERTLYTSIIYLEPFRDRNLRAFGFDMFSEPVRRTAMEQARDSGAPALSGKVELVQETGTEVQAGTLMYVPVYRNGASTDTVEQRRAALIGWSYSPYRMKDLLEGVLTNWDDNKNKRVHLQIYAGLEVKADCLLYDNHLAGSNKIVPLLYQQRTIDFNGQHWLLIFHPGEGVLPISYVSAWVTLAGGIVLSSLLFGLMLALARTQVRARKIAVTLTEELRRSGDLLRESEAALQSFTRDFEAFLAQTSDFVYFKDAYSRIRFCSKTLADVTGHRHWRDMVGKHDRELFPPDTAKIYEEEEVPVLTEGRPLLNKVDPYYGKEGHTRYVETNKWPLFDADRKVIGIFGISRDITERKRAEEALKKSERFLNSTIDGLTAHIAVLDDKGGIILTNKAYRDFAAQNGIDPRTVSEGANYLAVCDNALGEHSKEATPFAEGIRNVLSGKRRSFKLEYPCHSPSEERWFIAHVTPFDDEGPRQVIVAHENITERKRVEESLRENEEKYRRLFENELMAVCIFDLETLRFIDVNDTFVQLYGYSHEELIGDMTINDITVEHEASQEATREAKFVGTVHVPLRLHKKKDGTVFPLEIVGGPYSFKGRQVMFAMMRDITERKQAEEMREKLQNEITRIQKAESLGRMAGAIAHIFNNQLGVVIGNLEIAIEDLLRDAQPVTKLNAAMQGALNAAQVSGLMLTYLGQKSGSSVPMDLSEFCRQSLPSLRAGNSQSIILNVNLPSPGPTVKANANQIQQMLTNLVTNAREAIGKNQGTISLTVKTVFQTDISEVHRYPTDWQAENAAYACLEVTDTGGGIANEVIENIFDPFFSTKFTGRGLGLPVVFGIVRAHDGVITVASEDQGSTFRIFLPMSEEEIPRQPGKTAQPFAKEGRGTVLLIDDEEMIRDMAKTMVERLGYTVLAAKDGIEAMEMFARRQNEICGVISDVTMPRMNGWETLTALRKFSPGIPVILCSGYDEAQVLIGDHPERPQAFLHKPFQMVELKAALVKAMDD